ncbi:hypothetical protein WDU94_004699 [Cyamophila willieti]
MTSILFISQWTSLFYLISGASILRLNNKTFNLDNLGEDASLTLENNNSSVVIEIPKDSKFVLKDGTDRIIFSNKGKGGFSRSEGVYNCKKSATCEQLITPICLGTKLPYNFTTTSLVPDVADQQEAQERLKRWQGLKYIPKCWAVIQSFLCALYMPKCEDNVVSVPSQEVCKLLSGPCRIVAQELSSEFNCQNGTGTKNSRSCKNEGRDLKFNSTGQCKPPLVSTEVVASFYPGVEGCGLQCSDPLYTQEENRTLENTIFGLAITCSLFIVLSVMTLAINWEATSMYFTSQVILYINICFFNTCIGWLLQFTPGIDKEDIVCQRDGTLRVSGPRFDLCTVTFVIIYWSLISGLVWFIILTYILHITFQEKTGKIQESIRKKVPWFHIGAWVGVPLPLIIIICWIGEIDGNSVSGVCFVGYNNMTHRVLFFSIPVFVSFVVADIFLCKSLLTLLTLKSSSEEVMSPEVSLKVKSVYRRTLWFTLLVNGLGLMSCHNLFYELSQTDLWKTSLREFIVCGFGVSLDAGDTLCRLQRKPNTDYFQFHFLSLFATAVVITTYWVFYTESFIQSWAGFLKRLIRKEIEDPVIVPKYKLVRRAYNKSKKANVLSRLSVDVYETPQDPIGLNFELNSKASHGISPSWAAALPNLVLRRNALTGEGTDSNASSSSSKQNSEISYSVCRVSVESRRNSNDSSVSVQAVEVTKTVRKSRGGDRRGGGGSRKNKRRDHVRSSSTSQESFFRLTQVFAQSSGPEPPVSSTREPNLGRRTAIGGMDDNMLLLTSKLFSQLDQEDAMSSESGSEED